MHGVKRLFAWMIPRFDQVALQRLADQPAQEGSVGRHARGIRHRRDLSWRGTSSIPPPFPALLKVLREKRADIVHLHGYGATTFGRLCAWRHGHSGDSSRACQSRRHALVSEDRRSVLAPHTDLAIAVSESTGEFTTRARLMPAERTKVVYLGAPLDEFARPRTASEIAAARAEHGHRARHHRDRHHHAVDAVEGQSVPGRGRAADPCEASRGPLLHRRRRRAARRCSRRRRSALALGDRVGVQRVQARCRRRALGARCRGVSVAVGRARR